MLLLPMVLLALAEVLWVTSPNIPEAAGRYELDEAHPAVRGHLTWKSYGYVANVRTERRIALGSRCNGDVWLIGTTDAVTKNMGWVVTIQGNEGRSPDEIEEWGRVLNKDWVNDPTVRVTTKGPSVPQELHIRSPQLEHLEGACRLMNVLAKGFPVWECLHSCEDEKCEKRFTFTDSHGNWVLGPDYVKDTGWAMASHHAGRMPHQITDWRRQDGKGGWVSDSLVRMIDPKHNKSDASVPCSKFWVEGVAGLQNIAFVPSGSVVNHRKTYVTVDREHTLYWCPSCFLLAGKPAWKITRAVDISTELKVPSTTYPNCPGWLVSEDVTGTDFIQSAVTAPWLVSSGDGIWSNAHARLTCYDDLL